MSTEGKHIGNIFRREGTDVFMLCESLDVVGKCQGPVVLDISNMSKESITNEALELISKYGKQEALTELLDNLNAIKKKKKKSRCC